MVIALIPTLLASLQVLLADTGLKWGINSRSAKKNKPYVIATSAIKTSLSW